MNEKAKLIYEYIVDRISHNLSPTVREICRDLNIKSTSTVHRYINELCEEGLIVKLDNHNRSIQLPNSNVARVPILGNVAAGSPITAIEEIEGYIPFDSGFGDPSELFALTIKGDSMINAGIFDGDIVIVKKSPVARNGEIVVALVDDSATTKTFYKENGHFRLQPENDDYEPIIVKEVVILGKVVASIRYF
ncbi:LexA repressor [uncultured Ruminococcus sp.]|uniref:transcriptional repressor LexA n=1 Tax=Massiliimalia timonensis TaxID=1987501 RepID=UPI0008231642|nr:transcriptional repressor LexA [Massiliimalia timonensis]SCH45157.1 LexA repressor [uncultured Ruminococcus sp.]SCI13390.1 LexA repressor [uncultured Clostridium sp.]